MKVIIDFKEGKYKPIREYRIFHHGKLKSKYWIMMCNSGEKK